MRLTSTGLGIGTSSPAYKLDVVGSTSRLSYNAAGGPAFLLNNTSGSSFKSQITLSASGAAKFSFGLDATGAGVNNLFWYDEVAAATRMTLDSSGNLGLGVTPSAWANGYKAIQIANQGSIASKSNAIYLWNNIYQDSGGTNRYINTDTAGFTGWEGNAYKWYQAPSGTAGNAITFTQAMTLDASGNLLVGTTSSVYGTPRFQSVNASNTAAVFQCGNNAANNIVSWMNTTSGTRYHMAFGDGTTYAERGSISTNGTVTVYSTTSDYRLKTVIGAVSGSGARIDALEPIEYEWKETGTRTRGFLAHKFQEVYADSVTGTKDAMDKDGKPVYQAMQASSSEVIADLVAEIQSLRKRLAAAGI
jgi:hypothetical protein